MSELKPCPFCGGESLVKERSRGREEIACVGPCPMKEVTTGYYDTGRAAEAWNTRPIEDALRAELEAVKVELEGAMDTVHYWKAERDRLLPLARFAARVAAKPGMDPLDCGNKAWDIAVSIGLVVGRDTADEDGPCVEWVFAPGVRETMEELKRG